MNLKINAAQLLSLKAAREGRKSIPVSEVVRDMNEIAEHKGRSPIGRSAIDAWLNGDVTRFDSHIIAAWCDYLPCTVGQLIEMQGAERFTIEDLDVGQPVAVAVA